MVFQMIIFVVMVGVNDIWEDKNDREQKILIVDPNMVVIVIRAMMMLQVMTGGMVIVKMVILLRMILQYIAGDDWGDGRCHRDHSLHLSLPPRLIQVPR